MSKPVFLSYSTDDTAVVTTIRDYLEAQKIACWMAPRDILPGRDYAEQIISAIEGAVVLVLVLSESSNHSVYVRNEVERAVAKGKAIIPFRIHKVEPSRSLEFFISNHQWVEAWEPPISANMAVLAEAVTKHLHAQSDPDDHSRPTVHRAAPVDTNRSTPHNLPHQLTPLIGREMELADLDGLLTEPTARLVTILGPGGMGKTRLSLAVAERHLGDARFGHGVYFVALAPLRESEHIVSTLAEVLGLSLQAGEAGSPHEQVFSYLSSRSMLLVFDNFEHVLEGANLVAQILQRAAQVRILVTSRERLRVPGEHLFHIQGLSVDEQDIQDVSNRPAVQLFVQSARQLMPDLEFAPQELMHIANICRLVGGMPLGIELAAAWIEMLAPGEIEAEIRKSIDFLEGERRGGAEHHGSVRAVFDASWQRLASQEQIVFAQLSIFRSGFTREAAEQVADAGLRLLHALVSKSLLQHERAAGRYTVHELLRQFAEEQLQTMPEARRNAHDRHSDYFLDLLQQQESRLKGAEHAGAITVIEDEIENVRAAWRQAVMQRKLAQIDNALDSLYIFYMSKCWYRDGEAAFREVVEELENEAAESDSGRLLGRALARQARVGQSIIAELGRAASLNKTESLYRQSLSILQQVGAQVDMGFTLNCLGAMLTHYGSAKDSIPLLQEALAISTAQNDHWGMGRALHDLGSVKFWIGNYRQASEHFRQGLAVSEAHSDWRTFGDIANLLGESHMALGEFEDAVQATQRALTARTTSGDRRGIAWSLQLLGDLAWRMGDYATAQQRSEESLAIFQELGLNRTADAALNNLGNIASSLGDYQKARGYFAEVLQPHLEAGTLAQRWAVGVALTGLGAVLAAEGDSQAAAELFQHVLDHPIAWQTTKDRAANLLQELVDQFPNQSPATPRALEDVVTEWVGK